MLTGATGFLGTHILRDLLHRNYQVLIAKREETDLSQLLHRFGELDTWNIEDKGLESLFLKHRDINAIVHAATDYGRDNSKPTTTFWANETFPIRLIELAIENNVSLFTNIDTFFNSSQALYDHLGAYTLSKRHFQEWGQLLGIAHKINFANLRLYHLYGPGDSLHKFVPTIVERCLEGKEIDLTDGLQKRDFIHVDDAASAISTILGAELNREYGYHHYDVGTGMSVPIREFVETVREICATEVTLNFGALTTRAGEFKDACADTKALCSLGWKPMVGLNAGINSVIQDVSRRVSLRVNRQSRHKK